MVCSDLTGKAAGAPVQEPAAPVQDEKPFLAPRPSGGRQLTKPQLQAIHRYAAAHGKSFSNVSLEEVEESEGGVQKWTDIPQKEAEDMYTSRVGSGSGSGVPKMFPILQKREKQLSVMRAPFFCAIVKQRD